MTFISSDKVRRINAFTILVLLEKLPVALSGGYFEELMRHTVYEVKGERVRIANPAMANAQKAAAFKDFETYSKRKGALREKQLYQDVRLDEFFKTAIGVISIAICATCDERRPVGEADCGCWTGTGISGNDKLIRSR